MHANAGVIKRVLGSASELNSIALLRQSSRLHTGASATEDGAKICLPVCSPLPPLSLSLSLSLSLTPPTVSIACMVKRRSLETFRCCVSPIRAW